MHRAAAANVTRKAQFENNWKMREKKSRNGFISGARKRRGFCNNGKMFRMGVVFRPTRITPTGRWDKKEAKIESTFYKNEKD